MKITRVLALVAVVMSAAACDTYSMKSAHFHLQNASNDPATFIINSQEFLVAPQTIPEFVIKVPIPHNPVGTVGGPSSVDKVARVDVAVRNEATRSIVASTTCYAGAKIHIFVRYNIQFRQVYCEYS